MNKLIDNAPWLLLSVVILGAFLHAANAEAQTNIYLGAWSKHVISDSKKLNEQHNLFAVEHNDWFVGTFTNSYNRESYAVAHKYEWKARGLRAGVYVGAVRGYKRCWGHDDSNTDICPLVAPYVTYDATFAPQVMLIGEAVALTIKVRL